MASEHTVLLIQFKADQPMTRTYLDFDNISYALEGLMQIFE